jgi:hypothetical protein
MDTLTLSEVQVLIEKELDDHCGKQHSIRYGTLVRFETKLIAERLSSQGR